MGGRKRGGFFFRWMKSDLPDREENPTPVLLLAVHKTSPNGYTEKAATSPDRYTIPCSDQCETCAPRTDRHKHLFSQLNERFRKTLSLDSRVNRNTCTSLQHDCRPKSMVNATNIDLNNCSINLPNTTDKPGKNKRFRPKSFFTLETFLNSRRSEASSADDFSSSKYCKFYLDSSAECSPVLKGRTTPDLLNLPTITDNGPHLSEESRCKKQLDKLENHFNKIQKLKNATHSDKIDANTKNNSRLNEEAIYTEPVYDNSVETKTDKLFCTTFDNEINFTQTPNFNVDSRPSINTNCGRGRSLDYRTEKDRFLRGEPVQPLYTNFSRNCQKVDYTSPATFNSEPVDFFIPIGSDRGFPVNNNREHEVSQSPDPHCSSFKDCSNVLRKGCNANCSNTHCLRKSKGICCKEGTPSSAYEINITEDDVLINERTKNLVVKVMDKSVDSIGSCSLDVDADNTDFSDTTSGSLNILTPSSTTSHYRDFATKFQERATPGLRQDLRGLPLREEINKTDDFSVQSKSTEPFLNCTVQPKKPSYLHLACSINGYSNLTTYDSSLRQKLSRSRENSPARPGNISSFVMLRNRTDDAMAQRLNLNSANTNNSSSFFKTSFSETSISSQNVLTYLKSNGQNVSSETTHTSKSYHVISNGAADQSPSKSFIQQRVERLYGPGALAQGFFNQKKQTRDDHTSNGVNPVTQVSRSQHVVVKKSVNGVTSENVYSTTENYSNGQDDSETVLPVMRHLRAEFRAQLPIVSPKRSPLAKLPDNSNLKSDQVERLPSQDVVDRGVNISQLDSNVESKNSDTFKTSTVTIIPLTKCESSEKNTIPSTNGNTLKTGDFCDKDVHNVVVENGKSNSVTEIKSVECEENIPVVTKILESSNTSISSDISNGKSCNEKLPLSKVDVIQDGPYFLEIKRLETIKLLEYADLAEKYLDDLQDSDVSEEVRGFLRSAAGKARLLASQKMQQFEGLCHNSINRKPEDQFPTTVEDLRGFWDMVCLQIEDVRMIFEQINDMKTTGWKEVPLSKRMPDHPAKTAQTSRTKLPKPKKPITNQKEASSSSSMKSSIAKKRDEQRKAMLEAKRRAVKADCDSSVEIFAPPPPQSSEPSTTNTESS